MTTRTFVATISFALMSLSWPEMASSSELEEFIKFYDSKTRQHEIRAAQCSFWQFEALDAPPSTTISSQRIVGYYRVNHGIRTILYKTLPLKDFPLESIADIPSMKLTELSERHVRNSRYNATIIESNERMRLSRIHYNAPEHNGELATLYAYGSPYFRRSYRDLVNLSGCTITRWQSNDDGATLQMNLHHYSDPDNETSAADDYIFMARFDLLHGGFVSGEIQAAKQGWVATIVANYHVENGNADLTKVVQQNHAVQPASPVITKLYQIRRVEGDPILTEVECTLPHYGIAEPFEYSGRRHLPVYLGVIGIVALILAALGLGRLDFRKAKGKSRSQK